MRSRVNSVSADRLGNVLELLFATLLEANLQLAFDFAVHLLRNQDAARIGDPPPSRTAMLIPSPKRSPSAPTITSPRLTPIPSVRELRPDAMPSCISTAHRTAADGLANSANAPSPVVLISRPSWQERPGSMTSRFSRSNSA